MLRRFGIAALRPTQRAAFDAVASGRDVLVILPTGGGKSLCYQLPAACGLTPSLVISPLVALMKDQVDALRRRGLRAAQLSGAVSQEEREAAWRALEAKALDLLYLAPEALSAPRTRERLARAALARQLFNARALRTLGFAVDQGGDKVAAECEFAAMVVET